MHEFYHNGYLWRELEQGKGFYLFLSESLAYDVVIRNIGDSFASQLCDLFDGYEYKSAPLREVTFDDLDSAMIDAEKYATSIFSLDNPINGEWYRISDNEKIGHWHPLNGIDRFFDIVSLNHKVYAYWWDSDAREGVSLDSVGSYEDRGVSLRDMYSFGTYADARKYVMGILKKWRASNMMESIEA